MIGDERKRLTRDDVSKDLIPSNIRNVGMFATVSWKASKVIYSQVSQSRTRKAAQPITFLDKMATTMYQRDPRAVSLLCSEDYGPELELCSNIS